MITFIQKHIYILYIPLAILIAISILMLGYELCYRTAKDTPILFENFWPRYLAGAVGFAFSILLLLIYGVVTAKSPRKYLSFALPIGLVFMIFINLQMFSHDNTGLWRFVRKPNNTLYETHLYSPGERGHDAIKIYNYMHLYLVGRPLVIYGKRNINELFINVFVFPKELRIEDYPHIITDKYMSELLKNVHKEILDIEKNKSFIFIFEQNHCESNGAVYLLSYGEKMVLIPESLFDKSKVYR